MIRASRTIARKAVAEPHRRSVSTANLDNRTPLETALLKALKVSPVIERNASAGVTATADAAP